MKLMEKMPKKKSNKKTLMIFFVILLLIFVLFQLSKPKDALSRLQSGYKNVEIKETALLGHDSQKAFASADSKKILLQVVRDVKQDSLEDVFKELTNKISETNRKFTYFDPYHARTIEYNVPDKLKPVKEETMINNKEIPYYLVNANEILSILVFSEEQIEFKGLISFYYCKKESNAYRLEVYYDKGEFDKKNALATLNSLFCR